MKISYRIASVTLAAALAAIQLLNPLETEAAGASFENVSEPAASSQDTRVNVSASSSAEEIGAPDSEADSEVQEPGAPDGEADSEVQEPDASDGEAGSETQDPGKPGGNEAAEAQEPGDETDADAPVTDSSDAEADAEAPADELVDETDGAPDAILNTIAGAARPVEDAAIPAGLYTISCVKDSSMVLDIAGESCSLRADLVINKKNGHASQTFMISPVGGGLYQIINIHSGRILDVRGGVMEMRTRIQQYRHNQTEAQTFRILKYEVPEGGGDVLYPAESGETVDGLHEAAASGSLFVAFAPASTEYVLDVCGGTMANGTGIQLYRFNGTEAQQFCLEPASQAALTGGTYAIHSALNLAMTFDIPSASTASKATLRLWKGNYTAAQQFTISEIACPDAVDKASLSSYGYPEPEDIFPADAPADTSAGSAAAGLSSSASALGPILISPVCSALALDVEGGVIADGTDVRQYVENGTVAQAWIAVPNGNGTYTIASAANPSYVLDVSDGAGAKGANIAIRPRETDSRGRTVARQSFLMEKVDPDRILPNGPFKISAAADTNLVLEIQKGSFDDRANVRIHTWNDTNAQKYSLAYRGGGRYVITNARSGKVLDIAGGTVAKRTNIQQYRPNQTPAQDWHFVSNGGGAYTIVSGKDRNFCLDIAGGVIASDTNVQLYSRNGTAAQSFTLTPVRRVTEDWISRLKAAQTSYNTLIAVEATGTTAVVSLHKKDVKGEWKQLLSTSGFIGSNGLGKTVEGDRKTPVGVFPALDPLGIQPDPGTVLPYTQVDSTHYWVGDSASPYYNKLVSTRTVTNFNRGLSEHIVDYGFVYNYILPIGYNLAGTPYKGSAIFLHVSRGAPTAGCVSVPETAMITILKNATAKTAFVIDTPEGVRKR